MRTTIIFIAFAGPAIKQRYKIAKIDSGYECWNLKKFSLTDFVEALKQRIPPVNENVLNNYALEQESREIYGITDKHYDLCSWGLLIPDGLKDSILSAYP